MQIEGLCNWLWPQRGDSPELYLLGLSCLLRIPRPFLVPVTLLHHFAASGTSRLTSLLCPSPSTPRRSVPGARSRACTSPGPALFVLYSVLNDLGGFPPQSQQVTSVVCPQTCRSEKSRVLYHLSFLDVDGMSQGVVGQGRGRCITGL